MERLWPADQLRWGEGLKFFQMVPPGWSDWSLRCGALLCVGDRGVWTYGDVDAARLRDIVREAGEDRRRRCRSDLRSGHTADHAFLAEFGIIAAKGFGSVRTATETLHEAHDRLPELARLALQGIVGQLQQLEAEIARLEKHILALHRNSKSSRRLVIILGIVTIRAWRTSVVWPVTSRSMN
ncbi:hypothetical protein FHW79_005231 [Azospirillum sp. OGB3]|nr:hypothetical protein [Azospirillum sp. OGB3]